MQRRALAQLHRWLGLAAALWLFVLALSGSVLVFYQEADRALNPAFFTASPGPALPLSAQIAAAETASPGAHAALAELPAHPGEPTLVWLKGGGLPDKWQVSIDPATARPLGARAWGAPRLDRLHLLPAIYELHHRLLAGETLETALGILALVWALTQLVAVVLAFPNRRRWRASFVPAGKHPHARQFRWHRALGLWLLPVTLMLAVTGGSFHLPDLYRQLSGARPGNAAAALAPRPTATPMGWDRAAAIAGPSVQRIGHDPKRGLYLLRLADARDPGAKGQRDLILDAATGAALINLHRREGSAGDAFMAWQYPLHSGQAFGWPGRLLVLAGGLGTCTLIVLGVRVWLRRAARSRITPARPQSTFAHPQPAE